MRLKLANAFIISKLNTNLSYNRNEYPSQTKKCGARKHLFNLSQKINRLEKSLMQISIWNNNDEITFTKNILIKRNW